ncbi:hypothetical protein MSHOH_2172 [Methanosarcina horonobensis HB-1 = JCM 15518]|uniref:Uncharacterized protein n=2 Tax=Methanosarcina horonobensis TaxID=418008 RepID=A0A0E3WUD0_9EURY|nr:hypothetical protein [Methanosarcina horonobensis]AKB78655.1 hypothetical protein MSHOH_2172 [Methanosarcina horonobensis HB-1 = JCM 15518]
MYTELISEVHSWIVFGQLKISQAVYERKHIQDILNEAKDVFSAVPPKRYQGKHAEEDTRIAIQEGND